MLEINDEITIVNIITVFMQYRGNNVDVAQSIRARASQRLYERGLACPSALRPPPSALRQAPSGTPSLFLRHP